MFYYSIKFYCTGTRLPWSGSQRWQFCRRSRGRSPTRTRRFRGRSGDLRPRPWWASRLRRWAKRTVGEILVETVALHRGRVLVSSSPRCPGIESQLSIVLKHTVSASPMQPSSGFRLTFTSYNSNAPPWGTRFMTLNYFYYDGKLEKKKASDRIRTQDLKIKRRVLYHCTTTPTWLSVALKHISKSVHRVRHGSVVKSIWNWARVFVTGFK